MCFHDYLGNWRFNGQIAAVKKGNVYGMMPHPERTDCQLFKELFFLDLKIHEIMVSEHVSYKSTKQYLKLLPTTSKNVIVGPGENAGIVDIGNDYAIAIRVESHNHPTAIDPYQGAATGVGGIIRDIFTMGARPIALLDFLRFSKNSPLLPYAITGIADYGNCVGIPNVGGDLYESDIYKYNPLLNVACLGLVKHKDIIYGRVENIGDVLLYVGSRTGKDGVGGTSMASKELLEENDKSTIQHGDPFLEKLLLEACLEVNEAKLLVGMQDVGAGGILCSTVEMLQRGREKTKQNLGVLLNLDKVPVKETLTPTQVMVSETQERMIMAVKSTNISQIKAIFNKWDLECHQIGTVNNTGKYSLAVDDKVIYRRKLDSFEAQQIDWPLNDFELSNLPIEKVQNTTLWEEYDSSIGRRTIKGPLEPGHYAILDVPEAKQKLVLTWGNSVTDCYHSMRPIGRPLCLVNSLNFGNPMFRIKEFKEAVKKITKEATHHEIPVVGGNVSLYNATNGINIDGTVIILMLGLVYE